MEQVHKKSRMEIDRIKVSEENTNLICQSREAAKTQSVRYREERDMGRLFENIKTGMFIGGSIGAALDVIGTGLMIGGGPVGVVVGAGMKAAGKCAEIGTVTGAAVGVAVTVKEENEGK